jgi:hypothetical protein
MIIIGLILIAAALLGVFLWKTKLSPDAQGKAATDAALADTTTDGRIRGTAAVTAELVRRARLGDYIVVDDPRDGRYRTAVRTDAVIAWGGVVPSAYVKAPAVSGAEALTAKAFGLKRSGSTDWVGHSVSEVFAGAPALYLGDQVHTAIVAGNALAQARIRAAMPAPSGPVETLYVAPRVAPPSMSIDAAVRAGFMSISADGKTAQQLGTSIVTVTGTPAPAPGVYVATRPI